jgi:hypothetical protein
MNETQLIESYVARFDEPADWNDVLRRARRTRPRRRLVFALAVVVAALAGGPALGVMLTRDGKPQLPAGADKRNIVVVIQPLTGRIMIQAAPWKGHPGGVCYVLLFLRSGCTQGGTLMLTPPLAGYTFDKRVAAGTAVTASGKHIRIAVTHFRKLGITFFYSRGRIPNMFREVTLTDAAGQVVKHVVFKKP